MLAALAGTRYAPDYQGALLLTEDIGEESYRIDRMLAQLELNGSLNAASALMFGQFTQDLSRTTNTPHRPVEEVLNEYAVRNGKPAITNLMYGHTAKKLTLPFGIQCSIDMKRQTFSLDEAALIA
ncbi:MAG: hypothetical protein JNL32_10095 [Candidatus Kapabacteria bacterium]|nr:hypothetical protein [Candidatus Kapabacteria bacterium]